RALAVSRLAPPLHRPQASSTRATGVFEYTANGGPSMATAHRCCSCAGFPMFLGLKRRQRGSTSFGTLGVTNRIRPIAGHAGGCQEIRAARVQIPDTVAVRRKLLSR